MNHGFEGLKFHELRHTQATQLLANGVDVKTVQARTGHASPSITLGWYAHAIPSNDFAAAEMLGGLPRHKEEEEGGSAPPRCPKVPRRAECPRFWRAGNTKRRIGGIVTRFAKGPRPQGAGFHFLSPACPQHSFSEAKRKQAGFGIPRLTCILVGRGGRI